MTLISLEAALRDRYPSPGERIKQYVIDERKHREWVDTTCPHVAVVLHRDDKGEWCPTSGDPRWHTIGEHGGCSRCDATKARSASLPAIVEWVALRNMRPPICSDRTLLSDEVAPDVSLDQHLNRRALATYNKILKQETP